MRFGIKRFLLLMTIVSPPLVASYPLPISESSMSIWNPPSATSYGAASWYSESDPGINLHTANGEIFNDALFTCASWDFDFNTSLRVINLENGKAVICRVNDRGPAKRLNRLIDLTRAAFDEIADLDQGLTRVSVTPLKKDIKQS